MTIHDGGLRLVANFRIDSSIELKPNGEHSWVWVTRDHSGDPAGVTRTFALTFEVKRHAEAFKEKLEEAQTKTSPASLRAAGSSAPATTSSNEAPKTTAATEDEDAKPAALATTSKK